MTDGSALIPTASQTVGPFFSIGLRLHKLNNLVPSTIAANQTTRIRGRIFDGDGLPVPDAILEVWCADSVGKFSQPDNLSDYNEHGVPAGFARIPVSDEGDFTIEAIKPAPIADNSGET